MESQTELSEAQIRGELGRLRPYWYSPIDLGHGIVTQGPRHQRRFARRLELLRIPRDLRGKQALDIGAYDGFFTFHLEGLGAEVTSIDVWPEEEVFQQFMFARRAKRSQGRYKRMDVHDLSEANAGKFDLILCAGVLYHLRYPFAALERIRSVCRHQLILETVCLIPFAHSNYPLKAFFKGDGYPNPSGRHWGIAGAATIAWLQEALWCAGFSKVDVVYKPSFRLWKALVAGVLNSPQTGRVVLHAWV
jgi:SAM-dependent methyltransferase